VTSSTEKPNYYKVKLDGFTYDCLDVIEALGLPFHEGNVLKYLWRAGRKTPDRLSDLKKARIYIERAILKLEREAAKP